MSKLKIFVSAYACEPGLGSEIGVGWHWVLEMSEYFELWVLTRESNRLGIESWIQEHPEYAEIHFLYYDWPKWTRFWKKGLRGVRTYYNLWQICTNTIVKRTETIPEEFSKHYDRKSRWIESIRRMTVSSALKNPWFGRRCDRADLILCKTEITQSRLPLKCKDKAVLFTDVAADIVPGNGSAKEKKQDVTEFVTVGRLDAWRGFDLVVEAMKKVVEEEKQVHLTIVGDGPDRTRLQRMIEDYGLGMSITLTGAVSMENYRQLMENSDVVINAALKEGAVTVSFDSMAMGKPLLCLDTTGYTRYFSDDYAVVVPRGSRDEVIAGLCEGITRLTDPEIRTEMGIKAQKASWKFSWEEHGKEIRDTITSAYTSYFSDRNGSR